MSAGAKRGREHMRYGRQPGYQCLGKYRYHSQAAADKAIAKLKGPGRAYRCHICTYLHLTSKPKR